jgi:hypothetical protein
MLSRVVTLAAPPFVYRVRIDRQVAAASPKLL